MTKAAAALTAPLAPQIRNPGPNPDADNASLPCPHVGETLVWDFRIQFQSIPRDPFGKDLAEHLAAFIRSRGFTVSPPRLSISSKAVPSGSAIQRRASNLRKADELRARSEASRKPLEGEK